jgi:hypothetical protein
MERETPTVPETATQIDLKLAAIGVVSGIAAAMAMDAFSRCLRAVTGDGREAPDATPGADAGPASDDRRAVEGGIEAGVVGAEEVTDLRDPVDGPGAVARVLGHAQSCTRRRLLHPATNR